MKNIEVILTNGVLDKCIHIRRNPPKKISFPVCIRHTFSDSKRDHFNILSTNDSNKEIKLSNFLIILTLAINNSITIILTLIINNNITIILT